MKVKKIIVENMGNTLSRCLGRNHDPGQQKERKRRVKRPKGKAKRELEIAMFAMPEKKNVTNYMGLPVQSYQASHHIDAYIFLKLFLY